MKTILEREYLVLQIIDQLRIIRAVDVSWLAGYTDYTYCRKSLLKLQKMGLLQITRDSVGANCYYLSQKGLAAIGKKKSHSYEISYTTAHTLDVSRVCTWLHIKNGTNIFDMRTDSILKTMMGKQHRPDIIVGNTSYEIERNHKPQSTLENNILSNGRFANQVWIIPKNKRNIAKNIMDGASKLGLRVEIIYMDEIEQIVASANIHENIYDAQFRNECTLSTQQPAVVSDKYAEYFKKL